MFWHDVMISSFTAFKKLLVYCLFIALKTIFVFYTNKVIKNISEKKMCIWPKQFKLEKCRVSLHLPLIRYTLVLFFKYNKFLIHSFALFVRIVRSSLTTRKRERERERERERDKLPMI
ncbi:hypothetical protein BD770DRAFT_85653 [Pilaira anomala]|nr:hypothetical protein BD770DRAFT_85653 [Pilaira anomala]